MRVLFKGEISDGPISIAANDRGLTLGDGLFETLMVLNSIALWKAEHLKRMQVSALQLGMVFPDSEVDRAIADLCREANSRHHVLRITLTRGSAGRGLGVDGDDCTLVVTLAEFQSARLFESMTSCVVSVTRNEGSPASHMKTLSYIDQILAAREVTAKGFDEGIMLNSRGCLACSTVGNVFLVKGKTLITPSEDQGVLPGIMRRVVMDGAPALGYDVQERVVEQSELTGADGVFVTNSLRLLRPLGGYKIDAFPDIVELICSQVQAQCGEDPRN
jgi:branched-chain amino acid aminotransferase